MLFSILTIYLWYNFSVKNKPFRHSFLLPYNMTHIIKVSQFIDSPNATSREDGIKLFEAAWEQIKAGSDVELNFEGVSVLISRFLHASVGRLYKQVGNTYTERVKITNFSYPSWYVLYEDAIELAAHPTKGQVRANALSLAFEE